MAEPKVVEDALPVDIETEMQNDSTEDIIENIKVTYEEIPSDAAPDKTIPILVGVGVGLLTLLLIFLFTRRKSLGRDILIVGTCDSGKTTILSQLCSGKTVQTYTSMQHNKVAYMVTDKPAVSLVDVPGNDRVRGETVDMFSGSARGLVFVVDSNTVSKQIRDVAEYLHFLLTNKNIMNNSPPLLILCNKQDSGLAKGATAVQTLLEKEIEKVRMTRSNQLAGTQAESRDIVFLGREGKLFELNDLDCKVDFLESSALELDSLNGVKKWIQEVA